MAIRQFINLIKGNIMKKLLALATLLILSSTALAGFQSGNNNGSVAQSMTVAQALKVSRDDTPVQLTGKIVSQVDDEEYIFQDSTGKIKVDIDDNVWQGKNVNPNDKVTIYGKVDKEMTKANEVEVYRLQKH